ncbi:16S rRNA (cytidine(1402)-2'-O)-methyltransferase [Arenicella sp.]|nr:16S rRNA (cytidine(1402)-2'-O)-methyltransferase [Arenicella sp.]
MSPTTTNSPEPINSPEPEDSPKPINSPEPKDSPEPRDSPERSGSLYIVATPIGNLDDFSLRAKQVLSDVSTVLAEDTRHSKRLFGRYGITTRLKSCHEHNEAEQVEWVVQQLDEGNDLALISDAGTPLISDPGFVLVRALRLRGYSVLSVPGPSSVIAALSIAGLPTDRFIFDGFLPAKSVARIEQLKNYLAEPRTVVLLESSHRIQACLVDCLQVFGGSRQLVIARELTKKFETVLAGSITEVVAQVEEDADQRRGEFVLMLAGNAQIAQTDAQVLKILRIVQEELPLKKAAGIVANITGRRKNEIYQMAVSVQRSKQS